MQQKSASSKMRVRMRVVLALFMLLGFCVLITQLFMIQIVHGEMYQERATNQQTRATILAAKRGTIYDRNMNTLAKSATVWNVCISPAEIERDRLESTAEGLAEILDIDKSVIIDGANDTSKFYFRIKRRVDHDTMQRVLEFITSDDKKSSDIKGVFFEPDTKRYYSYGSLASTVLGFTNYDNQGAYGIEAYYNKVLSGTSGLVVSAKNAKGADMPFKYSQINEATDGNSIILTLDETVQHILERNLETAVIEHSLANRCAGIVMDVKTGEILAMSTKPDFDPNEPEVLKNPIDAAKLEQYTREYEDAIRGLSEDSDTYKKIKEEYQTKTLNLQYDQWRNKAISDPYEPGSVFKIITAATAFDNNLVNLNEGFFCSGHVTVSGHNYGCWKAGGHGAQNFTQAMQNSCNPVFIAIGQRIGGRMFYDYLQSFGLGELSGIDLPGEAPGIMQSLELLSKPGMIELSSTSFGQTFKITPLQMITAASAAINGGNLMQPYVVKQIIDKDGNVLETTQPTIRRQVVSEQTSAIMRDLVEAVVDGGSGRHAAIPGYRIGGKTGTSEKKDIRDRDVNVLSFIGFAPMEDPQYAVLVMLDEPKLQNIFGSTIAAPVVGAVLQEILPYLGIEPQFTPEQLEQKDVEVPDLVGLKPHDAQAELTPRGLKIRMEGAGPEVLRQIPQAWQKMPKGGTVIVFTDDTVIQNEIAVPNVVGLSAQEANLALLDSGLNIELRGVITDGVPTVVQQQWPLAGTSARTGDVIIVTLIQRAETAPVAAVPKQESTPAETVPQTEPADEAASEKPESIPDEGIIYNFDDFAEQIFGEQMVEPKEDDNY